MMRLPCRHFKCECGFFSLPWRGRVCLWLHTCLYCHVCVCTVCVNSAPSSPSSVRCCPPPPLWTSSSPLQLLSFSSQFAPFSLVTARALNFHDCCLFQATLFFSSPFLTCFTPPILLPYSLYSISCHSPPPSSVSLLFSHLSILP